MTPSIRRHLPAQPGTTCPEIFEPYGKLIPAGPVDDHLMDARIFRSIQNRIRRRGWVTLGEPGLRRCRAQPFNPATATRALASHPWERTILVPATVQDHALTVACGRDSRPRVFSIAAGLAVNLKPGIRFSALFPLEHEADYWTISGAGPAMATPA
ncbi:hypothetical protein [Oceaniglobus trochenteri]|uniref:hypothetical protein n=1 Tax=Oceaniglobus trochenteri TaxID=2763260 RepID=UPI001CFFC5FA|nr:hypothetical protein [Oceaniglobus trochenteri]